MQQCLDATGSNGCCRCGRCSRDRRRAPAACRLVRDGALECLCAAQASCIYVGEGGEDAGARVARRVAACPYWAWARRGIGGQASIDRAYIRPLARLLVGRRRNSAGGGSCGIRNGPPNAGSRRPVAGARRGSHRQQPQRRRLGKLRRLLPALRGEDRRSRHRSCHHASIRAHRGAARSAARSRGSRPCMTLVLCAAGAVAPPPVGRWPAAPAAVPDSAAAEAAASKHAQSLIDMMARLASVAEKQVPAARDARRLCARRGRSASCAGGFGVGVAASRGGSAF